MRSPGHRAHTLFQPRRVGQRIEGAAGIEPQGLVEEPHDLSLGKVDGRDDGIGKELGELPPGFRQGRHPANLIAGAGEGAAQRVTGFGIGIDEKDLHVSKR